MTLLQKLVLLFAASTVVATASAESIGSAENPKPGLEPLPRAIDPGKPNVLLIGDSISGGYTRPVRAELAGEANVYRIGMNGRDSGTGAQLIGQWLKTGGVTKWHVIHFNFGLHDIRAKVPQDPNLPLTPDYEPLTSPEAYRENLLTVITALQATGARLIWASTTPVPPKRVDPARLDRHVTAYNRISAELMRERGISINDLYAATLPRLDELQKPADVHFRGPGNEFLGRQVAAMIREALARPPLPRRSGR